MGEPAQRTEQQTVEDLFEIPPDQMSFRQWAEWQGVLSEMRDPEPPTDWHENPAIIVPLILGFFGTVAAPVLIQWARHRWPAKPKEVHHE